MPPSIGILGGVGAIASARFHLDLVSRWAAAHHSQTDDDFPRIVHVSESLKLGAQGIIDPDRTEAALLGAVFALVHCDRIAILCNSITQLCETSAVRCLHGVLTPVAACAEALQGVKRAVLLASESTIRDEIYQRAYPQIDWRLVPATHWIESSIRGCGLNVGSVGCYPDETIVLGCTELSTQVRGRAGLVSPTDEMIRLLCLT